MNILRWLTQALCGHEDVIVPLGSLLCVRCLKCGRLSGGVDVPTRVKVTR